MRRGENLGRGAFEDHWRCSIFQWRRRRYFYLLFYVEGGVDDLPGRDQLRGGGGMRGGIVFVDWTASACVPCVGTDRLVSSHFWLLVTTDLLRTEFGMGHWIGAKAYDESASGF